MELALPHDPALIWFLVGVALALLEFAAPGVIVIFFGVAAWVVALASWAGLTPTLESQLLLFAVASAGLLFGLRNWIRGRLFGHVTGVQDLAVNLDEFTGKPVEVLVDVTPGSHEGRVEFKGATWSARSREPIRKGEAACIERVDGLVLVVRKELQEEA
jgi:membrane protein implicated in regulation of membrane protease activity